MDLLAKATSLPFAGASAVRRARVFHPRGVLFEGRAELTSPWWPVDGPTDVGIVARLSRGIGLPSGWPDILGLAVRLALPTGPWDVLFATVHPAARVAVLPAGAWAQARFSTVVPYRVGTEPSSRWILATPEPDGWPAGTAAIGPLAAPLSLAVSLAGLRDAPAPAGRFVLERRLVVPRNRHPSFDPILSLPPATEMRPGWVATLRRGAYAGSRVGRRAAPDSSAPPVGG